MLWVALMQRKATKQSPNANASEKRHLQWVKYQEKCSACDANSLLTLHHCEGSAFKTNKVLVGHWFVLGLCECCDNVITRGSRRVFKEQLGAQSILWERQLQSYPLKHECPEEVINAIIMWSN